MFNLSEKDIGRHVRQISTGKIDRVRKDPGNGWIHPGVVYEWKGYRSDLEFVDVTAHTSNCNLKNVRDALTDCRVAIKIGCIEHALAFIEKALTTLDRSPPWPD